MFVQASLNSVDPDTFILLLPLHPSPQHACLCTAMSDAYYIPPSHIREGSELGRGAFGVVVQGFLKEEDGQEKQVSGAVHMLRQW